MKKSRDPRFDTFSGQVNLDLFHKSYAFLDTMKKDELSVVQKEIKSKKNITEDERSRLRDYMGSLKNDLHQRKNLDLKMKAKKSFSEAKKSNFHAKKTLIKERILIEKYKDLDTKALDSKLNEKKRKVALSQIVGMKKIKKPM